MNENHVYFAVFDFGDDPTVVTRIMNIEPTKAWAKGEAMPTHPSARETHSRWVLQSDLPLDNTIDAHLRRLLPLLEERRSAVRQVCESFRAGLSIASYLHEVNPGFCLDAALLRRIADLVVDVDFDLYCLPDAGEE